MSPYGTDGRRNGIYPARAAGAGGGALHRRPVSYTHLRHKIKAVFRAGPRHAQRLVEALFQLGQKCERPAQKMCIRDRPRTKYQMKNHISEIFDIF